jgi:hypothetical protein
VRRVVGFAAVTELILRCTTTKGVVEKRFEHDDDVVEVSRRFLPIAQLSYIV